ncbi:NAC domain-containing protein 35-like [Pyrus x bretschneideri]|uniref:NAC domain-containing protein 35-like n=1 Tax=Pyrus x bretschneideri TaxID=225117 RepID=UPI00202E5B92|nr:NAC domain-containing protein 35-like [Pyrus x bretschneideri]
MANFYGNGLVRSYGDVPLGFRFRPTDQELVGFYLSNRVIAGEQFMAYCRSFLHEFDPFGETEPWVIWENFGGRSLVDQDLYLFYELHYLPSNYIKRTIDAGGTWSQSSYKTVKDFDGKQIGDKRCFKYKNEGCEQDCGWLLEEYILNQTQEIVDGNGSDHKSRKVVLCRLKKNPRCANKTDHPTQELKEKPENKRARISSSLVHFDESNKKISGTNQDQECKSGIDLNAMPPDFSDHDCLTTTSGVCSCPICLDGGGGEPLLEDEDDEDSLKDVDLSLGPKVLPQFDET